MIKITQQSLHQLVDRLPECEQEAVYWAMAAHLKRHDPVFWYFMTAMEDSEDVTEEESIAIEEAWGDIKTGQVVSIKEIEKELAKPS